MISLVHNELIRHLEDEAFYTQLLDLNVEGRSEKVVLKDLQRHPAKPFVLHADFQRVTVGETLRMTIPLHFINEDSAKGVKLGGMVSHNVTEVEILCLPKDLPEYIEVDVADLEIGDMVQLSELVLPEGVTLAQAPDPDVPVAIVQTPQVHEEEPGEAGGEEGEGAEPGKPTEPES